MSPSPPVKSRSTLHITAPRARSLQQHRLIRQLIVAAACARKVTSEQRSYPEDADHRALAKAAGPIVVLHLAAHRVPFRRLDAGCDAPVGDDLDGMIGHEHIDQYTIVVLGVPDAELSEQLQRTRAR